MAIVSEWLKIDGEHSGDSLAAAHAKLDAGETEIVLDFSSVHRITSAALTQLGDLATKANEKAAHVALRAVTVDVYRVLKTARIASQFNFLN